MTIIPYGKCHTGHSIKSTWFLYQALLASLVEVLTNLYERYPGIILMERENPHVFVCDLREGLGFLAICLVITFTIFKNHTGVKFSYPKINGFTKGD